MNIENKEHFDNLLKELIESIEDIQRVRSRDDLNASSDGGSSGRSDLNDQI